MQITLILLSVLAGFLAAGSFGLLVFWKTLSENLRRRKNIKESVRTVASWCNRVWADAHDPEAVERRRRTSEPFLRLLLKGLYENAGRISGELKKTTREAKRLPLESAESAAVRMASLAREFESVAGHISAIDLSAHALRERMLVLLAATEAYRISLLGRIDAQIGRGVCLGRERKMVVVFGDLVRAHRVYIDAGMIDRLHRLAGMLIVLNSINGQVIAAESGRPIRWRSYRKDRVSLSEGFSASSLARRAADRPNWAGIRFMTDLLGRQTELMSRSAIRMAEAAAGGGVFGAAHLAAIADFQKRAAYTRVCIREFAGM